MKRKLSKLTANEKRKSDSLMNSFLLIYFGIGLLLAFYYDTWQMAVGVGGISLLAYYSARILLPASDLYQYILSAAMGVFMAQFIYQLHGRFEMHFFAFIGSAILVIYRNWKLQLPLAIVVTVQHAAFGYSQFVGLHRSSFTRFEHMNLETFVIQMMLIIAVFSICGSWSYYLKKSWHINMMQSFEMGILKENNRQQEAFLLLNENLRKSNELLNQANRELEIVFKAIEAVIFSFNMIDNRFIHISAACVKLYGYGPADFLADRQLWSTIIYPSDWNAGPVFERNNWNAKPSTYRYRIIHSDGSLRWMETILVPAFDQDGVPGRIDGICHDITERIALETKLAAEIKQKQREITAAVITAQENERYFLGEELHDNINPILSTARLYIDCVLSGDERLPHLLSESKIFIGTAINEIRNLSKSLIPPSLGEIGLAEAIEDMIDNIRAVNKLHLLTEFGDIDEHLLNSNLKLTIFRIVQEQVNNILKHANARNVWVQLHCRADKLQLRIKDDGVGFDMQHKRNGVGLQNITSRTELCNGTVAIYSSPGNGCELIADFTINTELNCITVGLRA